MERKAPHREGNRRSSHHDTGTAGPHVQAQDWTLRTASPPFQNRTFAHRPVQDVDHLLQTCPTFKELRQAYWPEEVDLSTKLWGPPEALLTTTGHAAATKLQI